MMEALVLEQETALESTNQRAPKIPQHHFTLALRGVMGTGKSHLASLIANDISTRKGLPIVVVCMEDKVESTLPWYRENCEKFEHWKGLTYGMVKKLTNAILILEDAPLLMRSESRAKVVMSIVTALARQNGVFTIITSQQPRRLPTALTIEMSVRENTVRQDCYYFRCTEGTNATDWVEWTGNDAKKSINGIVDIIHHGVKGDSKATIGRPQNKDSFRQKIFEALAKGRSIGSIVRKFPNRRIMAYQYAYQWRELRKSTTNNNIINRGRISVFWRAK